MVHIKTSFDDSGKGRAVVLLHGFPFDRSMWCDQIQLLAGRGYRAIAPDLRGLGESQFSGYQATMDDMARDVGALLDESQIDRVVVCGLSMGGYVAFEFVNLFPEKVSALVLAGTRAPADNEQEKQARERQVQLMLKEGMRPIAEATLAKLLAGRTLTEKPEVVERVRQMILQTNPQGAAAAQRGMAARRDYVDDLDNISVPALIIVGRDDPIRPVTDAEFMHQRIRNSQLEIIDEAAHLTNMEQPDVFNDTLLSFLKELTH